MSDRSLVQPASDHAELVELLRRVLLQCDGPRSVAQIMRDLPKTVRNRPEAAESLLMQEVAAGRLFEYPKLRNKAQFWNRSPLEFARTLLISRLQGAPVTRTEALKVIKGKAFDGLSKQVREQLFDDLFQQGALHQHPPFIGARAPRPKFASRKPAPADYLLDAIRKVADILRLSERESLETAVVCAHQGLRLLEPDHAPKPGPPTGGPPTGGNQETTPRPEPLATATDPQELLRSGMCEVNPRVEAGDMVDIIALRSWLATTLPGAEFDTALLKAAAQRTLAVHRYDRPGLLLPEERSQLLQD